jgi:hypothetical protein
MKITVDLPDSLMRWVKIRAACEGRKRKEMISDLLETGLHAPPVVTLLEGEMPYHRHPKTGFLVSRSLNTPGFMPPTPEISQAMIERANKEEDLSRAGLLR